MKLIRFGVKNNEKPGVQLSNGKRIDVSLFGEDYNEIFFSNDGIERLGTWLKTHQDECAEIGADTRLGSPVAKPSKIICIGLNYSDHAEEGNMQVPAEPILFLNLPLPLWVRTMI